MSDTRTLLLLPMQAVTVHKPISLCTPQHTDLCPPHDTQVPLSRETRLFAVTAFMLSIPCFYAEASASVSFALEYGGLTTAGCPCGSSTLVRQKCATVRPGWSMGLLSRILRALCWYYWDALILNEECREPRQTARMSVHKRVVKGLRGGFRRIWRVRGSALRRIAGLGGPSIMMW